MPAMRSPSSLQEGFEDPQLVQHLERGGVNRVAANIAQEVAMFFKNDDVAASPDARVHKKSRPR